MSTTRCERCKGTGYVCGRCGKPNRRPESRDRRSFGKGCPCFGARSVRCSTHTETTHRCDACGAAIANYAFVRDTPVGAFHGCADCIKSWAEHLSVAWDQWLGTRGRL